MLLYFPLANASDYIYLINCSARRGRQFPEFLHQAIYGTLNKGITVLFSGNHVWNFLQISNQPRLLCHWMKNQGLKTGGVLKWNDSVLACPSTSSSRPQMGLICGKTVTFWRVGCRVNVGGERPAASTALLHYCHCGRQPELTVWWPLLEGATLSHTYITCAGWEMTGWREMCHHKSEGLYL